MKKVCRREIGGAAMFPANTEIADIAVLQNIIYQMRDGTPVEYVVTYDEDNEIDWRVEDILSYINEKYGTELGLTAN